MHTTTELIALLNAHGLRLNKRLGQHYLIDARLVQRIVDTCELRREDVVLEIGAGLGALTEGLAERAGRVIAVEVDRGIAELLRAHLSATANVTVAHEDALRLRWKDHPATVVIGTIPYQITSEVIARLCQQVQTLRGAWLGVQSEVARRLCARPGTKDYGRLTILGQHRFAIEPLFRLPRAAFFPPPNVESTWIHLRPRPLVDTTPAEEAWLSEVVRAGFAQRRKTLTKCLALLNGRRLEPGRIAEAIRSLGLPPAVRGEALSPEQFLALSRLLNQR